MAITAAMVKELREQTGAGMMDCKKALAENDGDMEAAVDWLRTKGLAAASKKAGRVAAEGLVAVASNGTSGAVIEINAETDFVARNEMFQTFVAEMVQMALNDSTDIEALKSRDYPGKGRTVADELTNLIATIGENMSLRRAAALSVSQGLVATYVHNAVLPGAGKMGVLVALESAADQSALETLGKQLAMHIAATAPASLSVDELDPALVEREKNVLTEQAAGSGKPAEIIEKMVVGRINKFYQEVVLLKQTFVIDNETPIEKVIANASKAAGSPITLKGFVRFQLGEGIEKNEGDFAAEVAAMAGV